MNLKYDVPEGAEKVISGYEETIIYCLPFDVGSDGCLTDNCFVVATDLGLYVVIGSEVTERIDLKLICEIKCEVMVNGGILSVNCDYAERMLLRFTHKYLTQFSYFAKGVELLILGTDKIMISPEPERNCLLCGRILPGTKKCPRCSSRGRFLKRITAMIKPHLRGFLLITMMIILNSILLLTARYVERLFIDDFLIERTGGIYDVVRFFILVLAINITILGAAIFNNRKSARIGTLISRNLREQVYAKLQDCSLSFINDRRPGELINRVHRDTRRIQEFFETAFSRMFSTALSMIGAVTMMAIMDYKITLMALLTAPLILLISFISRKTFKRRFRAQWILEDKANNQLQDALSGIRVVKAFGREEYQSERFRELNGRLADRQSKNEKFWSTFNPAVGTLLAITSLIVLYMGGRNVISGVFSIGELAQFTGYSAILIGPLTWISMFPRQLVQAVTSMERIYDVLDEADEIPDHVTAIKAKIKGDVNFNNVGFGYKPYEPVLRNVSIEVKAGEMIGIVGPSGAGKSTMINLLIRLYDPDEGNILIDGRPLSEWDKSSYHSQIGVVLQETFLFSGSIYENIKYAKPNATEEEVIRASRIANAHDFITLFPDGYNTRVGDKGSTLSGGERQRIAIARAILSDPAILILDEATSSLDTETEFRIQEAIQRLTAGRTTFAIAHRLSTLRKSDRIIVIDGHKIAEFGKHRELMEQRGLYYDLVTAQLQMSSLDKRNVEKVGGESNG